MKKWGENKKMQERRESFLNYIASKTIICLKNEEILSSTITKLFKKATDAYAQNKGEVSLHSPEELFCTAALLKEQFVFMYQQKACIKRGQVESVLQIFMKNI